MYQETEFLEAIAQSFTKYVMHGARSTEKLLPIHSFLAAILQKIFGTDYEVHYNSGKTKFKTISYFTEKRNEQKTKKIPVGELTVDGKYYPKDIDICITKDNIPKFCLGIKVITSNYSQNANNYFENMIGETANIQRNNIPYAQLIIMRKHTPYYENSGLLKKIELLDKDDIMKYVKLIFDTPFPHQPKSIAILMIDIEKEKFINENDKYYFKISTPKYKNLVCPSFKVLKISDAYLGDDFPFLKQELSVQHLIDVINSYKDYLKTI
ncbi:MAG: hypothetical protein EAZ97_10515 [Bacteroidetes bacterium]|nr:MAG: hypothetical protein EAZ97_10515 [Bacteroidota bacterium]